MQLSDFNYELPPNLIAQHPLANRTDSRLLEVMLTGDDRAQFIDRQFKDILNLLKPGDLLVFNDTKVIPARLHGKKETGGRLDRKLTRYSDNFNEIFNFSKNHFHKNGLRTSPSAK